MKFAKSISLCVLGLALFAAQAAHAMSAVVLDPYLIRPDQLGDLQLQSFLAGNPNLANYQAAALSEDGVAAGIVLVATNSNSPVTISVRNVGGLEPYSDDFLQHAPATPVASLTVSTLWNIGGTYYAAALFQAPAQAPSSQGLSYTAGVTVTQTGNPQTSASIKLIFPPVVLVHGLWGDAKSLSDMQSYLDGAGHWYRQYVAAICYSKYLAFDATTDPLSNGKHPCEVTSQASLETEINSMLATLDANRIATGRVDIVAHSMGGLVLRNYASLSGYASYRNRTLGQVHTVATLNTPEIGSLLANFLVAHRKNTRQAPLTTTPGAVWLAACGFSNVEDCFAGLGYPLYGPGLAVTTGAVYSLEPGSPSLKNPDLSGPNIANAEWLAISSLKPGNSALATGVDTLIAALYANPNGSGVPTVDSILGDLPNDAIVALDSQTHGAPEGHVATFNNLSHTSLVSSLLTLLTFGTFNDNNVLQDSGVEQTASCWIATAGAGACFAPSGREEEPPVPRTRPALSAVDGIRISVAPRAELGKPFEIAVHSLIPGKTAQLTVFQQSDQGSTQPATVKPKRLEGDTAFVEVVPVLPGLTTFAIKARFGDAVAMQKVQLPVMLPKEPPLEFAANAEPRLVLILNDATRVATPRPLATYAAPVGEVALTSDSVRYRILPGADAPVVRLTTDGRLVGLRAGSAEIEGQLGRVRSRFQVILRATNQ
jgi:pimeloyl-ACP methyl ester carboxylesterase